MMLYERTFHATYANWKRYTQVKLGHAAVLVDPAHHALDLRLFNGEVANAVARGQIGNQRGGGSDCSVKAQPDARAAVATSMPLTS